MSDVSQGAGWWMASDAKWYPPESKPNYLLPPPPPPSPPSPAVPLPPHLGRWTETLMWITGLAALASALLSNTYRLAVDEYLNGQGTLTAAANAENDVTSFAPLFVLVWVATFVLQVVWIAKAHTSTTSLLRSPADRKYSQGWAIGVWFIPFANVFSTPRVFAEHQRIADATRVDGFADGNWRHVPVRRSLIWWWVLVLAGFILNRAGVSMMSDPSSDIDEYQTGVALSSLGMLALSAGTFCGARFIGLVSKQLRPQPE
jgi:hypothetical protein